MASLFVIQGRDQGKRFELDERVLPVGRERGNTIQIHDSEVSRRHAEIRKEGEDFTVIDLSSANGCFVNGERVNRKSLRSGDRVVFGGTTLIFTHSKHVVNDDLSAVIRLGKPKAGESRILQSVTQQESGSYFGILDEPTESTWLARARSNLQIMYRTALAVSHTLDIDQLLERILELIFEWVEADRGCVMLKDETGELVPKARRDRSSAGSSEEIVISKTISDFVMGNKEGVLTSDAREDERWDPTKSIVKMGVREAIAVPMQGRYDVVGLIYIDTFTAPAVHAQRKSNKFNEEHLKLMVAIGHQAALAVEDTSYYSAMVQAERLAAVGQTIATLSHHIKNVLQGIRGGSFLIDEGLKRGNEDAVRKGWGIVDKNQEKISKMVMDMLTFSKEREPEMEAANLNEVCIDVAELVEGRAQGANVTFSYQPADDLPLMLFDKEGLHRAILNVAANAVDACDQETGGVVKMSVGLSEDESQAWIKIADNGRGIEPADLKRVFLIFESKKGNRGTGLGLPVTQKIMQEHGGDVTVESKVGTGSVFTLTFPVNKPQGDTLHG